MFQESTLNPTRDYISGGYLGINHTDSYGVLSSISDDLQIEVGYRVYEKMMADAKVSKCVNVLKTGIVGDGIELLSPLSDTDPEYPISAKIEEFCTYNLTNLQKAFREIVWEMLDALVFGHKVAEITYKLQKYKDGKTYMILSSIKPKPFGTTNFVVDPYFNLLGLIPSNIFAGKYKSSNNLYLDSFKLDNSFAYVDIDGRKTRFLNRDKFFVLSVNSKDNDPRGHSILRSAYTPWNIKNKVHCEYLRYLNTSASPLLVGFTSEESYKDDIVIDNEGKPVKDASGKPIRVNPIQSFRDALVQAKNSGVLAARAGSQIEAIGGDGAGIAFYKAIEVYDEQIEMSILLQTLATSESRFQTRSASETHAGTLELVINHYKLLVADAITEDILKPLIEYNFGKEYFKYIPKVSLGDTQRRDFSLDAAAISGLYSVGYLSEDQKRFTDLLLGLPVRDSEYDKIRTVSTDEQLSIRESALNQEKLKNEAAKLKEESRKLITQQIGELAKTLELITSENLRAKIENQLEALTDKLMEVQDTDNILDNLKEAQILAKDVLTLSNNSVINEDDSFESGNLKLLSGTEVGTNALEPLPISIKPARGGYVRQTKKR